MRNVRRYFEDKTKAEKLYNRWKSEGWKNVRMYYYYTKWCVSRLNEKEAVRDE